jgi:hypothetical protein
MLGPAGFDRLDEGVPGGERMDRLHGGHRDEGQRTDAGHGDAGCPDAAEHDADRRVAHVFSVAVFVAGLVLGKVTQSSDIARHIRWGSSDSLRSTAPLDLRNNSR